MELYITILAVCIFLIFIRNMIYHQEMFEVIKLRKFKSVHACL